MGLSALISAWLAGALGAVHCIAMCGSFLAATSGLGQQAAQRTQPLLPARALALGQFACSLGRISTYALLGALLGSAGGLLTDLLVWQPVLRALYVAANLLLFGLALAIVSRRDALGGLQRAGAALFARMAPALRSLHGRHGAAAKFGLGMIWGLVPCALIYSVLPIALFAGGAWQGAAVMLAFGVGTLPSLVAAGWVVARAPWAGDNRTARLAAAMLIGGFAVFGAWRALFGPLAAGQGAFCLVP
jgi:sulfite exporter TauE/SafE